MNKLVIHSAFSGELRNEFRILVVIHDDADVTLMRWLKAVFDCYFFDLVNDLNQAGG